jgi:hypothetical protein
MPHIDITVNETAIGYIDTETFKVRHQLALEDAASVRDVFDWLVLYAHADPKVLDEVLGEMTISESQQIGDGIQAAIKATIPNTNGAPSPRPSQVPRGRVRQAG